MSVVRMLPSALLTASASPQAEFSELNLRGLLPRCVRFAPTSHPVSGNTRYRPACSLWPCGTCTRWIPSRGFTVSSSVPPLPSFSQRDNNVGSVKGFLSALLRSLVRVSSFVLFFGPMSRGVSLHAGVSDLAESNGCSRFRIHRCCLPSSSTASAL